MRDFDIDSDLKQEKFQSLKLVQGDRGNKIKINVYEDGQPVNLAGCSVTAKYKRADGEIINDGVIENIHDNSFDAVMDSSITKVAGTLKMLFTIEKDDVKVSTFLLLADVRESIGENTGSSGGNTGGGSGEVKIDLSNYYKKIETYSKNQIDARFKEKANTQYVNEEIAKAQLEGAGVDTSNFIVNSDLTALENEVGFTRTRLDNLFISDFKTAHTGTWSGSQTAKTSNINKSTVSKEFLSGKYFCVINFDLNFNEELTSKSPYVKLNLKGLDFNNNTDLSNGGIIPSKYSLQQYNNNVTLSLVTEFTETKNAYIALSLVGLNESTTRTYEANIHWATIIKVDDYNERYDSLVINNAYLEQYVYVNDIGKISKLQSEVNGLQKYIGNQNIVDYWGDSLTYGNQDGSGVTRATVLKQLLGDSWTVNNYGSGGETSNTIACRQGGIHLVVQPDFTIPETITAVSIDIVDSEGNSVNLRSSITDTTILDSVNPVEINGVKGNLGQGSTFGASPYTFTRLEAGDSVDVNRPTRVITKSMRELNNTNNVMIIWIGQNGGYDDVNTLISQINQMIKLNNTTNYLVISLTSGGKETINTVLNKEFGVKFIDARQYLIDYGLDDAGLTPTQEDLDNISNNLVPKSLLIDSDNVHFNKYGYTIIANLEYKRGKELGYW
jgi:lysophospholipase L1-like esterase